MSYELEGKLHKKFGTETKGDKGFRSRSFVIETAGQYPQMVKVELAQDKCELIDNIHEGTPVKVWFDLRGREWQGKYFTNLNAWRVEPMGAAPTPLPTLSEQNDGMPF